MKHFGTVKSFDSELGSGEITPESGGGILRFEHGSFAWENKAVPTVGQRLSYDVGTNNARQPYALNVQAN